MADAYAVGGAMDTSMFWFGDMNLWGSFPTVPSSYLKPRAIIFSTARLWCERLAFVTTILQLRQAIYAYNFQIVPSDKKYTKKVGDWWEENREAVGRFNRDVWQEFMLQRNAIALWRRNDEPIIYLPEHCTYTDELGIEKLSFVTNLSPEMVNSMVGLSANEKAAMKKGKSGKMEVQLTRNGNATDNKGFFFRVCKEMRRGGGLAWPAIRSIFNTVQQWEALELADWQLSDAMRTIYEMHKVGHAIVGGQHAGKPAHFLKEKRANAIRRLIKNKDRIAARVLQMIVNFDHTVEWPRPDPKHLKADRYEAALQNLMFWSAPLGQMLVAKSVNPFLLPMLKAQAYAKRDYLSPFIERVLKESMGMPEGARVSYGDDCLMDGRLLLDVLKTGLAGGPLSQETFLEKSGVTTAMVERPRKAEEGELPDEETQPIYDAAHGANPPRDPARSAGNPGGPNKAGKNKAA